MNEVKQISRLTPCNKIEIWQPRYKDKRVLIAKFKVGTHNEIIFTKAKHLMQNTYYISGEAIRKAPTDTNGSIPVYAVDLNELKILERI